MMRSVAFSITLLAILPILVYAQAPDAEEAAAQQLTAKGLTRQGSAWINATEAETRATMDAIPAARHAFYLAEYERWELMLSRLVRAQKEEQKKLERDLVQQRELAAEIAWAREKVERFSNLARISKRRPPKNLAEPEVHRKVQRTINTRNKLAVLLLKIKRLTDDAIIQSYLPYLQDADVGNALRTFGPQARLGPLKRYDSVRRNFARVYDEVFTDRVPVVPVDDRFAFWGLANERVPIELMYRPESSLTLLPEELVKQLHIELDPEQTPRITVSIEEEQQDVFLVTIPSLRIGKHVIRNVEAAVLPRAKRGQLGHGALASLRPTLHPGRLELELTSVYELEDPPAAPD